MRELQDVLQSPIDKLSDHHHPKHARRLKTVMEAARLLKSPEGVRVEDLRAAMNAVQRSSDVSDQSRLSTVDLFEVLFVCVVAKFLK